MLLWYFADRASLWYDDIATIKFIAEGESQKTIYDRIMLEAQNNPPLFYILAYFWIRLVPYGTANLKLPSIVFTCLGIWFCGTAAKRLRGNRAAVIATVFAATSIYIARYAALTFRCYGLMLCMSSLTIVTYHKRLCEPDKISMHIVYGLVLTGMLYTSYMCGLVVAALGLCDICLFFRKKVKFKFAFSYIGAGALFFPLLWEVLGRMVDSHVNFWPATPTFSSLLSAALVVFSNNGFVAVLFAAAVAVLAVHNLLGSEVADRESVWTMWAMVLWFIFVFAVNYIYSHYLNPTGSIFHVRYFVCTVPVAMVLSAIGLDWLIGALGCGKPRTQQRVMAAVLTAVFFSYGFYVELSELLKLPAVYDQPIEQAIDWIYSHEGATSEDVLVTMTVDMEGLYYYGSHGCTREDLHYGHLTNDNWQQYKTVYASPMQDELPAETSQILNDHYVEVEKNDGWRVTVYAQKQ